MGCSTSSQFTRAGVTQRGVSLALIASDEMEVRLTCVEDWATSPTESVKTALKSLSGAQRRSDTLDWRGRTLMLVADGLRGGIESLVEQFNLQASMSYQIFGSVAADDITFDRTTVFHGDRVHTGAFVAAEILSPKPFGIGYGHGWKSASEPLRVTRCDGARLLEINGRPAWEAYETYARRRGVTIPEGGEQAFLIGNVLGLPSESTYKLRVPLGKNADGSLNMAVELHEGEVVEIMEPDAQEMVSCGASSLEAGMTSIRPSECAGGLVIECAATQLQLGDGYAGLITEMLERSPELPILGGASYGQVVRTLGGISGVSCASSVACLVPR